MALFWCCEPRSEEEIKYTSTYRVANVPRIPPLLFILMYLFFMAPSLLSCANLMDGVFIIFMRASLILWSLRDARNVKQKTIRGEKTGNPN